MRVTIILLLTTCGAAFCQTSPSPLPLNDNLRQHLGDLFQAQRLQTTGNPAAVSPMRLTAVPAAPSVCSIPLLNAKPLGKPVTMPSVKPEARGPITRMQIDRMQIVAPAPACPANFARNAVPAPAPAPPPATEPPAKP